jgi:hypothetical protein
MADFQAHRANVGIEDLPQFQVFITLTRCGVRDEGHVAITDCATVTELDEEVERLVKRLYAARDIARGFLEENEGIIS